MQKYQLSVELSVIKGVQLQWFRNIEIIMLWGHSTLGLEEMLTKIRGRRKCLIYVIDHSVFLSQPKFRSQEGEHLPLLLGLQLLFILGIQELGFMQDLLSSLSLVLCKIEWIVAEGSSSWDVCSEKMSIHINLR